MSGMERLDDSRGTGRSWVGCSPASGGLERVRDVALLRHGYVLPDHQRAGLGARLVEHLETEARGVARVVVGTYRGNYKAQRALEKAGYRRSPDPEAVLRAYYSIPEARLQSSVTYEKTLTPESRRHRRAAARLAPSLRVRYRRYDSTRDLFSDTHEPAQLQETRPVAQERLRLRGLAGPTATADQRRVARAQRAVALQPGGLRGRGGQRAGAQEAPRRRQEVRDRARRLHDRPAALADERGGRPAGW